MGFAAQEVPRCQVAAIPALWQNYPGVLQRAHRKPGVQPETDVCWPIGLFVLKYENDVQTIIGQSIIQPHRYFAWIFAGLNLIRGQKKAEGGIFAQKDVRIGEVFVTDETVVSSPDLVPGVERAFSFQPMDEIPHHRSVILPALCRGGNDAVPKQVAIPGIISPVASDADQLSSQAVDDDAKAGSLIHQLVQPVAFLFETTVLKTHTSNH